MKKKYIVLFILVLLIMSACTTHEERAAGKYIAPQQLDGVEGQCTLVSHADTLTVYHCWYGDLECYIMDGFHVSGLTCNWPDN